MKRILSVFLILVTVGIAQSNEGEESVNPCQHPLIQKARRDGLNSLSLKEIPQFWLRAWECKRRSKKTGEEVDFSSLYRQKQEANYQEARKLSGIGTCCLTVVTVIFFYSYLGYFAGR